MWSLGLAVASTVGLWLAGSDRATGWLLCLIIQFLWIAYALATAQYGFILYAIAHGVVYWRNYTIKTRLTKCHS